MYTVSIGCLRPQGWLSLFRVFRLGGQALRAAQAEPSCVTAQIFRRGKRYFAFSVWESPVHMKAYATTGVHGQMMRGRLGFLKDFSFMAYL
ncbi:MAG: hypothetical protein H7317_06585, partial [Pseudorhodobacter sp.]|nr:hypothetical protein [Pseudorhodobacter sp.]